MSIIRQCRTLFFMVLLAVPLFCRGEKVTQYCNPMDVSIADPQILKDGADYYLYGTSYNSNGFSVFTSSDLVHWRRRGMCYQMNSTTWGQSDFWAPEVIRAGSYYYMFYTCHNPALDRMNICVARATSPLGPFIDVTTPILPTTMSFIDGHPFYDVGSGRFYLYAVNTDFGANIMVTELTKPPVSATGPLTNVLAVSQDWEGGWVEGPFVIRHENSYYMMYSGPAFWQNAYSIGYATASSPLGPWTKFPGNPILHQTAVVSGPGHNSVVESPDGSELYVAYHTHFSFAGGHPRQLALDRLVFVGNGTSTDRLELQYGNCSANLLPLPAGAVAHDVGTSDEFNESQLDWMRWSSFGEEPSRWRLSDGKLLIETQAGDISGENLNAHNIFLQHAPSGDFTMESQFTYQPRANFEQAFIVLWGDQSNFLRLSSVYAGRMAIEVGVERSGAYTGTTYANKWGDTVRLKVERRGDQYYCYASSPALPAWEMIGSPITFYTVQSQVGLGAISPGSGARKTALFDYFRIEQAAKVGDWDLY